MTGREKKRERGRDLRARGRTYHGGYMREKGKSRRDPCLLSHTAMFYPAWLQKGFKALLPLRPEDSSQSLFPVAAAAVAVVVTRRLSQRRLLQAAVQDGQLAILAKSICWQLLRHKQFMHFAADLPNEIHRAQSAGKINDANTHFNLALFPPGMPTTSHSIVSMLLWQFWSELRRPGQENSLTQGFLCPEAG